MSATRESFLEEESELSRFLTKSPVSEDFLASLSRNDGRQADVDLTTFFIEHKIHITEVTKDVINFSSIPSSSKRIDYQRSEQNEV